MILKQGVNDLFVNIVDTLYGNVFLGIGNILRDNNSIVWNDLFNRPRIKVDIEIELFYWEDGLCFPEEPFDGREFVHFLSAGCLVKVFLSSPTKNHGNREHGVLIGNDTSIWQDNKGILSLPEDPRFIPDTVGSASMLPIHSFTMIHMPWEDNALVHHMTCSLKTWEGVTEQTFRRIIFLFSSLYMYKSRAGSV